MKRFNVMIGYAGSIVVGVNALDENDACEKARDIADEMNDQDFLEQLNPQYQEANIVEG